MENENKVCCKPMYKCGICGEVYESIRERMWCETGCLHKQEVEEQKIAEIKKKEEQTARKAEVDAALEKYLQLKEAYLKDYDTYEYNVAIAHDNNEWNNLKSLFNFFI